MNQKKWISKNFVASLKIRRILHCLHHKPISNTTIHFEKKKEQIRKENEKKNI